VRLEGADDAPVGQRLRHRQQGVQLAGMVGVVVVNVRAVIAALFLEAAARAGEGVGISSNDLARRIPGAIYCPTLDKVTEALRAAAQPGDLIITVGAGDIYKAGEKLLREN